MEPITLALIALLLSAGTTVAMLTGQVVHQFVSSRSIRAGTAEIIRNRLQSGRYEVVAGVFNSSGAKVASRRWNAASIDSELQREFGNRNVIQIKT